MQKNNRKSELSICQNILFLKCLLIIFMESTQNLQYFKISHSSQFIQIKPNITTFSTQILINKRTLQIVYESTLMKQIERETIFTFSTQFKAKDASLILGIIVIEDQHFLVYANEVYPQSALPDGSNVYQIASVDFIPYAPTIRKSQQQILDTIKQQILSFGFYFSMQRDLTLSEQARKIGKKQGMDERFFWNKAMLGPLQEVTGKDQWIIPVIQGHYGCFQINISGEDIKYYVISRRSKFRSGARYFSRGINENGNCANFIQTQQIVQTNHKLFSTVFVSGSAPIFWQQKSVTSSIRLSRRKQLTKGPFMFHIKQLHKKYGRVVCLNLMEKKKQEQNILIQAFQQMFSENQKNIWQYGRYFFYDLNSSLKNHKNAQIIATVRQLDVITQAFSFFQKEKISKSVLKYQIGTYRINCLDCLSRTNKMMQCLAIRSFVRQLESIGIEVGINLIEQVLSSPQNITKPLIKQFRKIWNEKADFQSLIYTGSKAIITQGNKFIDELSKSLISITRLYNQTFNDKIKQKGFDVVLGNNSKNLMGQHLKHTSPLTIAMVTWNVNAKMPQKLDLQGVVDKCIGCDIIAIGIQQMIDLDLTNNMVEQQEKKMKSFWIKALEKLIRPQNGGYIMVQYESMVGLFLIIFISEKWKNTIKGVYKDTVKTGMGGQFGNKGGIIIRINIYETSVCFICCHLAAHSNKVKERIDDFVQIHKKGFQQNKSSIQNQYQIELSDYCFLLGDLNFRIDGEFKQIFDLLEQSDIEKDKIQIIEYLLSKDQLLRVRQDPQTPGILANYSEKEINFLPTYKLDKETGHYSLTKNRNPSWCDRILYSCDQQTKACKCIIYDSINAKGSDHRPVFAQFTLSVFRNEKLNRDTVTTLEGKEFRDSQYETDL